MQISEVINLLRQSPTIPVQAEDVLPLFGELFTRAEVKDLLKTHAGGQTMYWRVLTPLVVMWGLVFQRLNKEHTCDSYVAHLRSGAVDSLDEADPHQLPLSQRIRSESNSGYVQGRQRLPVAALIHARLKVARHAAEKAGERGRWRGLAVRLLDGTLFRLPPEGDLVSSYGQSRNQHGTAHWVQARVVLACDYFTQTVVGMADGPYYGDETDHLPAVLQAEEQPEALYIADRHFGVYRVLQVLAGQGYHALLRLQKKQALALLKRNQLPCPPAGATMDIPLTWQPSAQDQVFPDWPTPAVTGRLLVVWVQQDGFQPFTVYLFTTLLEAEAFPLTDLCLLYSERWDVEIHFRHIKTALEMDFFPVRSKAMFLKELQAGLLTYNLVCCLVTQAALRVGLRPAQLSFKQCLRRVLSLLTDGVPVWVAQETTVADWLLGRLGQCKLPRRNRKVQHEPRKVRYPPQVYGELRGDRASARQKNLEKLQASPET